MPIPKPKEDETEKEFIKRCMSNDTMNEEYEDNEQRAAICYQQWRDKDKTKTLERKEFPFEVKELDEETGVFTGYAATFREEPDSYGDVIEPGAFKKTIKDRKGNCVILFNHNPNEPIGLAELEEDEKGLFIKSGKLSLGTQKGKEVLALIKDKVITTLSIGYDTVKQTFQENIRHLKEIRLWDVSPVTFAADDRALITSVKSLKPLIDEANIKIEELRALLSVKQEPAQATPNDNEEAAELEAFYSELVAENDTAELDKKLDAVLSQLNK